MNETVAKRPDSEFSDDYLRMYPEAIARVNDYRARHPERRAMAVKSITIVVTEDCTLRCSYCYQHNKNCDHRMSEETARRIVDLLFEEDAKDNMYLNPDIAQALILDFIGGEPLLEIGIIGYFMRYFLWKAIYLDHRWATHYMISISSNGTLCDDPDVKKFLTTYKGRVSLGITIDGNQTLHDACRRYPNGDPSYDIVASAVHMCQKKYGVSNVTKLTLAPENVAYLYDAIMNLYNEFDFSGVYANCVYEDGWTNAHALTLYEQMKKLSDWMIDNDTYKTFYCTLYSDNIGQPMDENNDENWCGGTGAMLCFTTDGNITPCLRYTQFNLNDKQPEIRIGNLDTGIANEKCDRATMDGLDKITRRSQSTDECFSCPIASGCAWCSAFCYEETGTPNKRVTYICPMHKARVMSNVYFWNKLYRKLGMDDRFECHIPKEWALEIIPEDEYKMLLELASDDKL